MPNSQNPGIHEQLGLFTQPKAVARERDPETSWQAAQSVTGIREQQAKIWHVLARSPVPLTDEDILSRLEPDSISPSGARTRRKELCDLGLVKWSGAFGKTLSSRKCRTWEAVPLDEWKDTQLRRTFTGGAK